MDNKDLIIRASGNYKDTEELLLEVIKETKELNLIHENKSVREVPKKIKKADLQNKKAKDLKISAQGTEENIEEFIESVIDAVDKDLKLAHPSRTLKIESESNNG